MKRGFAIGFVLALALPAGVSAQADPLVSSTRVLYDQVKDFITRSAEQVPEADYSFRPTESVRTFGQLIGHVANAHYMFCSTILGEQNPSQQNIEQTRTTKAELVAALAASFEYCDRAYRISDAQGGEIVNVFGNQRPKLFALNFNVAHDMEHYGNIVTYMRIRGMTPPSSQRGN